MSVRKLQFVLFCDLEVGVRSSQHWMSEITLFRVLEPLSNSRERFPAMHAHPNIEDDRDIRCTLKLCCVFYAAAPM